MNITDFLVALFGLIGIAAVAVSIIQAPRVTVVASCKRFPERRAESSEPRWRILRQLAR
jgi:hypothetical protein